MQPGWEARRIQCRIGKEVSMTTASSLDPEQLDQLAINSVLCQWPMYMDAIK